MKLSIGKSEIFFTARAEESEAESREHSEEKDASVQTARRAGRLDDSGGCRAATVGHLDDENIGLEAREKSVDAV